MPLSKGAYVGSYEILALLGAGGMGEVYRARDPKLNREVAVKILPAVFSEDPGRLARFRREAQALAALNHPNIAAIYSLEEFGNTHFLTMEYVLGAHLKGPLPLDQATAIAHQIAYALQAAHEKGIVHRDLKPANVHVTVDGKAKVLDFGLAKLANETEDAETQTAITQVGVVLGTLPYMSPEQVRGRSTDKRVDIWAFGCVLYEMLTGQRAFSGKSAAELSATIISNEPDWNALPPGSPAILLRWCLEKDPSKRLQDIGDAFLIEAQPSVPIRPARFPAWVVAGTFAVALLAFALWLAYSRRAAPLPYRRLVVASQETLESPAISPDGRRVAYTAKGMLYVRDLSQVDAVSVADSVDSYPANPFWSPDSRWIGYSTGNELRKVAAEGGSSKTLCKTIGKIQGAAWTGAWDPRGVIVYAVNANGIFRVSADGGEPVKILDNIGFKTHDFHQIVFLNRGDDFLTWAHAGTAATLEGTWLRVSKQGSETRKMSSSLNRTEAAWESPGFLLISEEGTAGLWSVPWDGKTNGWGTDKTLIDPLGQHPNVSADGSLVYLRVTSGDDQLLMVNRGGQVLRELGRPLTEIKAIKVSPDGERVAFECSPGVWIFDFRRENATHLVNEIAHVRSPHWSSDGKLLGFVGYEIGFETGRLYTQPSDSSASPEKSVAVWPDWDWSPDGDKIVYSTQHGGNSRDILVTSRRSGTTAGIATTRFWEDKPEVDPSGRYLAYQSDESGRAEIYVRTFPAGSGKWLVSANGGRFPHWGSHGTELFYLQGETLVAATVSTTGTFQVEGPSAKLFSNDPGRNFKMQEFAPMPDSQRFLIVRSGDDHRAIVLVENWQLGPGGKSRQ
jgi:serine/threonine protein kinase